MVGKKENDGIALGYYVQDSVTGFQGYAVSKHSYLYGCTRITVQPLCDKDNRFLEAQTFDEPQLKRLEPVIEQGDTTVGGPEKYSDVRKY